MMMSKLVSAMFLQSTDQLIGASPSGERCAWRSG
jgi:hypothetical protein